MITVNSPESDSSESFSVVSKKKPEIEINRVMERSAKLFKESIKKSIKDNKNNIKFGDVGLDKESCKENVHKIKTWSDFIENLDKKLTAMKLRTKKIKNILLKFFYFA